mmetsp:Transcript_5803/g.7299  ORF Transcript_5803/g.7299 Transcript_5803/m.7299 type:complete len:234 (-) Transcript_5803:77-778(-)|eukprot:CAMPEP_0172495952 /NCGR_PEP_ID=MMETSP1066-20121228/79753_1 /TAXON_ID=671091 /ORGANISM="Coscinodiscus wailesii, Strain CCMP2513" /LENGTH=233 /DNA_ID=CAMNT_0013267981 /DNA_START=134 /DNA_END=835 /DNA_ORIENTATION=+
MITEQNSGNDNNNVQVVIEEGATVASTARIELLSSSSNNVVEITIGNGTVFHPESSLIVIPKSEDNSTEGEEEKEAAPLTKSRVIIGENNLFEEECRVEIDLNLVDDDKTSDNDPIQIIGNYNVFSPRSRVTTGRIGTANSFQSASHITSPTIGQGFVAGPLVRWNENRKNGMNDVVMFLMDNGCGTTMSNGVVGGTVQMRSRVNGTERNMKELDALLPAVRNVVKKNFDLRV